MGIAGQAALRKVSRYTPVSTGLTNRGLARHSEDDKGSLNTVVAKIITELI